MTAHRGAVVWLTGLSGAGKSTLARHLKERLGATTEVEILDGDEIREQLSPELGYSRAERDTNVRRIAFVAELLARHHVIVLAAVISPYAATRAEARQRVEERGSRFFEVYVRADLATVAARDVKGLYAKAAAGEVKQMTGVSAPYEAPTQPDLELVTDAETVAQSADRVVALLTAKGILPS